MSGAAGSTATNREYLKFVHEGNHYYRDAEAWIDVFWSPVSIFADLFRQLDLKACIELACGHGRHTAQVIELVGNIVLVDINQSNLSVCRERFAQYANVDYYLTMGSGLDGLASESYTSLFCYDAMVHFEAEDTIAYLHETSRVLVPGGRALLHYSNYDKEPRNSFQDNPHWRNFFSSRMMEHFASRAGFTSLANKTISWPTEGGIADLDGIVLLEKMPLSPATR